MPPLTLAGERITPLLPINPILLEYFTPEDLNSRIRFVMDGADKVKVTLDLPLSGMKEGAPPTNHRLTHTYSIKRENTLAGVPVLEVWPNFRSPNWQDYYTFYYDAGLGKETFQAEFANGKDANQFKDSQGGIYKTMRLNEFPTSIQCKGKDNQTIGLILLRQPSEVNPSSTWKVGVDFGTSFTNVYVGRSGSAAPLALENLHFKITDSPSDTRFPSLFEYFIPEVFIPNEKPLPLSSVLTMRGIDKSGEERPILDGRIYIPNNRKFFAEAEWIRTNLKWRKDFRESEIFLRHLILHISALAVNQGADEISWFLSFPSVFSRTKRTNYAQSWQDILNKLSSQTGVTYHCSDNASSVHYKTESLAIAQYFADQERQKFVTSTCIDMGGGTSDISIWEDNCLVHQCSVQFAGRDLLSKFLELKPELIIKQFSRPKSDWHNVRDGAFHAKLDVLLRWDSEEWLSKKRRTLDEDEEFQDLIRLTTLGVAGLYYYVGLLLKTLNEKGKYKRKEITPVYLGGNGSRLLNWIDSNGKFSTRSEINELLSRMMSKGSNFADDEKSTHLSRNPKDEVACGLVLDKSDLTVPQQRFVEPIITGETCELNGVTIAWNEFLEMNEDVTSFRIPNFDRLARFLYDFDIALRDLKIESIRPLKEYKRSLEISDNPKIWNGTRRELDHLLQEGGFTGNPTYIQIEPPFILCLKALLNYLGSEWANR
jgi:hypothetical protein